MKGLKMLKKGNVVAGLLLAVALLIISVGCSDASEKAVAENVDVEQLRNNPELGFAPLPIKFGETVGLVVHFNQGETLEHLKDLKNMGIKWVRDEEYWGGIEKKKGEYVWPAKFKRRLKFYKENGIGNIFALTYSANKNVYPDDPYNPEGFGRYAVAAAKLHKDAGVEFVLEIFNEPANFGLRKKYGGKWYGEPNCPWIDHYAKMVIESVRQVKAYDPNMKIITTDHWWSTHYWWLEKDLPKELDGFAVHPYAHGAGTPGPEIAHFGKDSSHAKPWTIMDDDRSNRSLMRRLRAQYAEKIGRPLEMYITEWGYALGRFKGKEWETTEDLAAALLPRVFINGVAAGARVVSWYCSSGDGTWGLIRDDQTKRKTYYSLKAMVEQLGDYQMIKQLVGMDGTTKGIQAYLFEGDAGYKLAVWNIEGPVEVTFDSGYPVPLKVYDHFGKALPFRYVKDGLPILKLDRAPIYIEGIGEYCLIEPLSLDKTK
ncbi:MAG: hypothetical protein DRP56_06445 [Planctomycetota bacterium]|nr:MAG: hypothetical protein DRP56_06445 [Planctomycetota bacterium]